MRFGILGPLEVLHDDVRLEVGGARRKAVLARLLVDAGRVVSIERLVDDVWPADPPATARKSLQKYVAELRQTLIEPVLRTAGSGYALDVPTEDIDAGRFERLLAESEFAAALDLWRGEVLADLPDLPFADAERARLDELRLVALQGRIEVELEARRHEEVVGELADLCHRHPHRERLVALLMLALYRSGRPAEALDAFQHYRGMVLEDLGTEPGPELRELQVEILRQDPTLAAPDVRPSVGNVPEALTSFVGRERELARLTETVAANRLVTLTGPGGIGKTRLASELARRSAAEYDDGTWIVDLAELTADDQVPTAAAVAMRLDVRPAPDDLTGIEARLAHGRACLLVLDNCEHVVAGSSALVRRLLHGCPRVRVLATSRRPLGVEGEYVVPVPELPDPDAVRLFVERGRRTGQLPEFGWGVDEVTRLCRGLDGLPLAIELAASQLRVLTLSDLAARLGDRLAFRGTGEPSSPRQGTLRDMVAWSHELVPEPSRRVFARLGAFRGPFTLPGAEAVCADLRFSPAEVLGHVTILLDHSLLLRTTDGTPDSRYRLLESLRIFAAERLVEEGVDDLARRGHARYFASMASEAGRHIVGPDELSWQRALEDETADLDAALSWAADHDWSLAVDLAVALAPYWDAGWGERAAVAYLDRVLSAPEARRGSEQWAWALTVAADMAANQGDARRAVPWARQAVASFGTGGDPRGRAAALVALGSALGAGVELPEAAAVMVEAVEAAERLGDDVLVARAINRQHFVAARRGDAELADELGRRELDRWRAVGSARGEATALRHLAVTAFRFGDLDRATSLCQQALAIWNKVEDAASVAHVNTTLGDISRQRGDTPRATALYRAALVDLQTVGDRRCEASTCKNLATILASEESHHQSARLYREGIELRHELGDEPGLAECFEGLAANLSALERHHEAATLLGAAAALRTASAARPSEDEQAEVDRLASAERQELGAARFDACWERGRRMHLDEVVGLALAR